MKMGWRVVMALGVAVALGACDKSAEDSQKGRPDSVAGEKVPSKTEVKKAAATAGPEDCPTYFKEVRAACKDNLTNGLDIRCHKLYVEARVANDTLRGKVGGSAGVEPDKLGGTLCKLNLKKLRKKRAKKDAAMKAPGWGPECKAYFTSLDKRCLAPLEKGKFIQECNLQLNPMILGKIKPGGDSEKMCKGFMASKK